MSPKEKEPSAEGWDKLVPVMEAPQKVVDLSVSGNASNTLLPASTKRNHASYRYYGDSDTSHEHNTHESLIFVYYHGRFL